MRKKQGDSHHQESLRAPSSVDLNDNSTSNSYDSFHYVTHALADLRRLQVRTAGEIPMDMACSCLLGLAAMLPSSLNIQPSALSSSVYVTAVLWFVALLPFAAMAVVGAFAKTIRDSGSLPENANFTRATAMLMHLVADLWQLWAVLSLAVAGVIQASIDAAVLLAVLLGSTAFSFVFIVVPETLFLSSHSVLMPTVFSSSSSLCVLLLVQSFGFIFFAVGFAQMWMPFLTIVLAVVSALAGGALAVYLLLSPDVCNRQIPAYPLALAAGVLFQVLCALFAAAGASWEIQLFPVGLLLIEAPVGTALLIRWWQASVAARKESTPRRTVQISPETVMSHGRESERVQDIDDIEDGTPSPMDRDREADGCDNNVDKGDKGDARSHFSPAPLSTEVDLDIAISFTSDSPTDACRNLPRQSAILYRQRKARWAETIFCLCMSAQRQWPRSVPVRLQCMVILLDVYRTLPSPF